jgi:hypothetical protein
MPSALTNRDPGDENDFTPQEAIDSLSYELNQLRSDIINLSESLDECAGRWDVLRERLRKKMIDAHSRTSGTRTTYEDGYCNGLAEAIDTLDRTRAKEEG